jgi:hypothetical protein
MHAYSAVIRAFKSMLLNVIIWYREETTRKDIEMMLYSSSLLPTASMNISENVREYPIRFHNQVMYCSVANLTSIRS